jgi:hypothetical protein
MLDRAAHVAHRERLADARLDELEHARSRPPARRRSRPAHR